MPYLPEGKALRKKTSRIYSAITLLADATRDIPGRKNMVLFTLGFGEVDAFGAQFSEGDRRYYPKMKQALNDNNVAVYPVYLMPKVSYNIQRHFLNQLAWDSGGIYHSNFVNFITPIRAIAD